MDFSALGGPLLLLGPLVGGARLTPPPPPADLAVKGGYASAEAFTSDLKLVVDNARTFNPEGHPVNSAAAALWDTLNQRHGFFTKASVFGWMCGVSVRVGRAQPEARLLHQGECLWVDMGGLSPCACGCGCEFECM